MAGPSREAVGTGRRRRGLTVSRVVAEAVRLADAGGLESVTVRKVSASLGFTTMAIYRHVESREELLLFMLDAGLAAPPPAVERSPARGLRAWTHGLHARYLAHPWLLDVALPGVPATENHAAWVERLLAITEPLALPVGRRLELGLLLDAHARNRAHLARNARQASAPPRRIELETRFPLLAAVATTGELADPAPPDLDWGIDVILAGAGVGADVGAAPGSGSPACRG